MVPKTSPSTLILVKTSMDFVLSLDLPLSIFDSVLQNFLPSLRLSHGLCEDSFDSSIILFICDSVNLTFIYHHYLYKYILFGYSIFLNYIILYLGLFCSFK